jgi:excisionase family DNA binding protein
VGQGQVTEDQDQDEIKEFLSVKETALLLGVHQNTVYNWLWDGKLPYLQLRAGKKIFIARKIILHFYKSFTICLL